MFNIHSRTSDAVFRRSTGSLNIDVVGGRSVGTDESVSGTKHAVVCRLQQHHHHHNNNNAQATSNLQRIKRSAESRSTYGSLVAPFELDGGGGPKPRRDYGALKGPSPAAAAVAGSSLMRRWSTVRGVIEGSSNSTTTLRLAYPCRPPHYCLHSSSRLRSPQLAPPAAAEDQISTTYPALCRRHRVLCSSSSSQLPSTDGCSQSAANRLFNPPDVIASPETEAFYCSAATDRRFVVLDWRMTQEAEEEEEEEEENALSCDVIDAENTATAAATSSELRMTSHDVGSTKTIMSEQMDNEIL